MPALFPLLFWLDQHETDPMEAWHLFCVHETVKELERLPRLAQ